MQVSQKIIKEAIILSIISILGFVLYFRCIDNAFLSDDYDSLYRIVIEKRIIFREFFRPMIDFSFYLNYIISGLDPRGFYIFNILIHVLNTYLIYKLILDFGILQGQLQYWFATLSALLFMFYPFHNESIVWLSGRLSSIAALCALLAMWLTISGKTFFQNTILPSVLLIIALLAYESIVFLPAMLMLVKYYKNHSRKSIISMCIVSGSSLLLYLAVRYYFSSIIDNGGYGTRIITGNSVANYLGRIVKAFGRSFLPPMQDTKMIVLIFAIACIGILIIERQAWRSLKNDPVAQKGYLMIILLFAIALLLPALFGINTRTSEGDRLLYFPSCFLAMHLGLLLCILLKAVPWRMFVFSVVSFYFLFFLQRNNQEWEKASNIANSLMSLIKDKGDKFVVLVNVPDAIDGAFVFRNGLLKAVELNKIDTTKVIVNNYLVSTENEQEQKKVEVMPDRKNRFIAPSSQVILNSDIDKIVNLETGIVRSFQKENSLIYYWNRDQWMELH